MYWFWRNTLYTHIFLSLYIRDIVLKRKQRKIIIKIYPNPSPNNNNRTAIILHTITIHDILGTVRGASMAPLLKKELTKAFIL